MNHDLNLPLQTLLDLRPHLIHFYNEGAKLIPQEHKSWFYPASGNLFGMNMLILKNSLQYRKHDYIQYAYDIHTFLKDLRDKGLYDTLYEGPFAMDLLSLEKCAKGIYPSYHHFNSLQRYVFNAKHYLDDLRSRALEFIPQEQKSLFDTASADILTMSSVILSSDFPVSRDTYMDYAHSVKNFLKVFDKVLPFSFDEHLASLKCAITNQLKRKSEYRYEDPIPDKIRRVSYVKKEKQRDQIQGSSQMEY